MVNKPFFSGGDTLEGGKLTSHYKGKMEISLPNCYPFDGVHSTNSLQSCCGTLRRTAMAMGRGRPQGRPILKRAACKDPGSIQEMVGRWLCWWLTILGVLYERNSYLGIWLNFSLNCKPPTFTNINEPLATKRWEGTDFGRRFCPIQLQKAPPG